MGDSDVGCFNRSRNLTHLYLQCPSSDNEVSDGLCGDPTCMDLPFREYVSDHIISIWLFYQVNFFMGRRNSSLHSNTCAVCGCLTLSKGYRFWL
jgi:hypothetical protein